MRHSLSDGIRRPTPSSNVETLGNRSRECRWNRYRRLRRVLPRECERRSMEVGATDWILWGIDDILSSAFAIPAVMQREHHWRYSLTLVLTTPLLSAGAFVVGTSFAH
jgi:hypothetical protein